MEVKLVQWRYVATMALALAFEALYSLWGYGVAHNILWMGIVGTSLLPFVNLTGVAIFVDAKTWKERTMIALYTALGYAAGTCLMQAFLFRHM